MRRHVLPSSIRPILLACCLLLAPRPVDAGECPDVPGDVAPGLLDVSTQPPTWLPQGDGRLSAADAVVLALAARGEILLAFAPGASFPCVGLPGDLHPGVELDSTDPPSWAALGDGVLTEDDIAAMTRQVVGARAPLPRGRGGTWTGALDVLIGGEPTTLQAAFHFQDALRAVSGCASFDGDEAMELTGSIDGDDITLVVTAVPADSDDCHLFPVTFEFLATGEDRLELAGASGDVCDGDGAGGHEPLQSLQGVGGSLQPAHVGGSWTGTVTIEFDGVPKEMDLLLTLGLGCGGIEGLLSHDGGEGGIVRGHLSGDVLTLKVTAVEAPESDDCHLFPVTLAFDVSGEEWELVSASGFACSGDGNGGHLPLEVLSGGSGGLARRALTGTWTGDVVLTVSDEPFPVLLQVQLVQFAGSLTGSACYDGGEVHPLVGHVDGDDLTLVITPVEALESDDCHLYPINYGLTIEQGALTIDAAMGHVCEGEGIPGTHSSLDAVTDGEGTLVRH